MKEHTAYILTEEHLKRNLINVLKYISQIHSPKVLFKLWQLIKTNNSN